MRPTGARTPEYIDGRKSDGRPDNVLCPATQIESRSQGTINGENSDPHAHLGECCVFGLMCTEEDMMRRMEENGVDATIVQPYPGAKDFLKRHDEIAALCEKHPGRFFGLASLG